MIDHGSLNAYFFSSGDQAILRIQSKCSGKGPEMREPFSAEKILSWPSSQPAVAVRTVRKIGAILKRTSCYHCTTWAVRNSTDTRRVALQPEECFSHRDINNRHTVDVQPGCQSLTIPVNRNTEDVIFHRKRKSHRGPLRFPFVQDFDCPGESGIIACVDRR